MPSRPPLIRMQARTECKPWQRSGPDLRKRGRAGQRDRAEVLREEPLCRACTAAGRVEPSTRVDHIKPLSDGGSDERENKQGLCEPCHDAKSKAERAAAAKRRGLAARS
jgi:5-methylcytosine-specific restriction protein A